MKCRRFHTGLVLSGGAARGLAHLGVLKGLEEARIPIDIIAGTSIGALVGAMYAVSADTEKVIQQIKAHLESNIFKESKLDVAGNWREAKPQGIFSRIASMISKGFVYSMTFSRRSMISEEAFAKNINALVDNIDIRDTKIKFSCVALDLCSGQEVVMEKGPLRQAVQASCAMPGIMPPVEYGPHILVDGSWINNVPVAQAWGMGAHMVIAATIRENPICNAPFATSLEVVSRSDTAVRLALSDMVIQEADVVIAPEVEDIPWYEFGQWEDLYRRGLRFTRYQVPQIRSIKRRLQLKRLLFS